MDLRDQSGKWHVPYNSGLYVFDLELLLKNDLPDYATPPKEIMSTLPKSPKIGYAITDIMAMAHNPAVLAIAQDSYENIKSVDDAARLLDLAKRCGVLDICKQAALEG
jgi:hypothetical protein